MCPPTPFFCLHKHSDIIEIVSIMGTTECGEDFTSGVSVFIVTNSILLVSYLVQKHTLDRAPWKLDTHRISFQTIWQPQIPKGVHYF